MTRYAVILSLSLSLLCAAHSVAQHVDTSWTRRFGTYGSLAEVRGMVVDSAGYVYVTGRAIGAVKYASNGDTMWQRQFVDPGYSSIFIGNGIAVDRQGNVYVTGAAHSSLTGYDYATIKYYPNGDTAWIRYYDGPSHSYDWPFAIGVDAQGNVFVTGTSQPLTNLGDYATIKYLPNGDTAWVRRYDGPLGGMDEARALAIDQDGSVYVTGSSPGAMTSDDFATIKYDADGSQVWLMRYDSYRMPGGSTDAAKAITLDPSGNVFVAGLSTGLGGSSDYAVVKYSADGFRLGVWRYDGTGRGTDWPTAIISDAAGNIYVTGFSSGIGSAAYDYATIKYFPNGDTAWVRRYDTPSNGNDQAQDLAIDGSGNVYVTGLAWGTGTDYDYMTIKYAPNGDELWQKRYNSPLNSKDQANIIAVDHWSNVYVGGRSSTTEPGEAAIVKYEQKDCIGTTGDVDCGATEGATISDLQMLVEYLFEAANMTLGCPRETDINASGVIDVSDVGLLVDYLFGSVHPTLPDCRQ